MNCCIDPRNYRSAHITLSANTTLPRVIRLRSGFLETKKRRGLAAEATTEDAATRVGKSHKPASQRILHDPCGLSTSSNTRPLLHFSAVWAPSFPSALTPLNGSRGGLDLKACPLLFRERHVNCGLQPRSGAIRQVKASQFHIETITQDRLDFGVRNWQFGGHSRRNWMARCAGAAAR
jgi:hypothetical protein